LTVKIRSYILGAALAAPLVLATAAGAHVTLQPSEVPAGGFTRLDVRVPTERPDASTTKVEVQFPPGFTTVSTEPVPGWTAKVARVKLAKPQVNDEGEKITDRVDTVTWTAAGGQGGIGPGQFQDFGLSLAVPDKAGSSLTFKAVQTYSSGEVVRWIGPPDSEEPAPQVKLTAAEGEGGAAPAAQQEPASGGDDDGGSDTLSIIALIVGAAGLAAGIAALLRGRGRTRVGAT
jgi:periplasmic copper chaperone A